MRIAIAAALRAACAARAPQLPVVVTVGALPPAPSVESSPSPAPPPAAAPPSDASKPSPEQLADLCRVVPVEGDDGKPRLDLARVDCEPPAGTPGPECLAGALFAASVSGVARDRIWFVYRVSPAEQVPAGQFRHPRLHLGSGPGYD